MARPVIRAPGGLARVEPRGGAISGFARVSPQRIEGNEILDFGPLAASLSRYLRAGAQHAAKDEIERGQRFAFDNPEVADQIDEEVQKAAEAASDDDDGFDAINETFLRLVQSGAVPEAANPIWQLGYIEQRARDMAGQVRTQLLDKATFDQFTALSDDGDAPVVPPDLDAAMAKAFQDRLAGTAIAESHFGLQAYNAAQEGVQNEVRERVRQVRLQTITEDRRVRLRNSLGRTLLALEMEDFDRVGTHTEELGRILEMEGRQRGIPASAARGELLNTLKDTAMNTALDDPDRALALVRRAGAVEQNGVRLDHPGTESALFLNDLVHQLSIQADDKAIRNIRLRSTRIAAAKEFASGWLRDATLEAIDSGDQPAGAVDIAVDRLLGEDPNVEQPPTLTGMILELEEGVEMPKDIRGHILAEGAALKRVLQQDALDPNRQELFLNQLEIDRIENGLDAMTFLTRAWDEGVKTGAISVTAYKALREETDRLSNLLAFKSEPGSTYATQVAGAMSDTRIPAGLPAAVRQRLLETRLVSLRKIDSLLQGALGQSTATDEAGLRHAFNAAIHEQGVRDATAEFTTGVQDAIAAYHDSIRGIRQSINGFRFAEALAKIDEAQGISISGDDATTLRQDTENARKRQEDLIFAGPISRSAELSIRSQALAILQVSEADLPPGETDRIADQLVATFQVEYGDRARKLLADTEVPTEQRGQRLRDLSHAVVNQVMEPWRDTRLAERASDLEGVERAKRATNLRMYQAKEVYTGMSGRSTFFFQARDGLTIPVETYELVEDIGYDPWFSSAENHRAKILNTWDRAIFHEPESARAQAFVATHGQYRIPWKAVIAGKITVKSTQEASSLAEDFPLLEAYLLDADDSMFAEGTQDAVQGLFEAHGLAVEFVKDEALVVSDLPTAPAQGYRAIVRADIDLTDAPLSGFVTRYFDDIAEFHALPEDEQKKGLATFGFDVSTAKAFEQAREAFVTDQISTIKDWKTRE
jgi:hypothetical protein